MALGVNGEIDIKDTKFERNLVNFELNLDVSHTDSDDNVSVGTRALDSITAGSGTQNVAVGVDAGTAVTTGDQNVLIGDNAGASITSGSDNVFIGADAGDSLLVGTRNIGIGTDALTVCTTNDNIAIGYQAGDALVTGTRNIAIGRDALGACTTNDNIAIGYEAGKLLTTGKNNVLMGLYAGDQMTTAKQNTAIGTNALGTCTADNNIAIGYLAGSAVTSGTNNIMIGESAGIGITTNSQCIAIGRNTLFQNTTNGSNIAIGFQAGSNLTGGSGVILGNNAGDSASGSDNTIIGDSAGTVIESGASNVIIGSAADVGGGTATNNIVIGYAATSIDANNVIRFGNTSQSYRVFIGDTSTGITTVSSGNGVNLQIEAGEIVRAVGGTMYIAYKDIQESVSSSETLQADNDITLTSLTSGTYKFDFTLFFSNSTSNTQAIDIKWLSTDSSPTLIWQEVNDATGAPLSYATERTETPGSNDVIVMRKYTGALTIEDATSDFTLTWAQNSSSVNATNVEPGTCLVLTKIY